MHTLKSCLVHMAISMAYFSERLSDKLRMAERIFTAFVIDATEISFECKRTMLEVFDDFSAFIRLGRCHHNMCQE